MPKNLDKKSLMLRKHNINHIPYIDVVPSSCGSIAWMGLNILVIYSLILTLIEYQVF